MTMPIRKTATIFFILSASFLFSSFSISSAATLNDPISLNAASTAAGIAGIGSAVTPAPNTPDNAPTVIVIPSIGLAAGIRSVGTDATGAMAVPTIANTVGWYGAGTVPGATGSAVLDAHVYLAFKNLKNVKPGDGIYVEAANGIIRYFVVTAARTYADAKVPLNTLFNAADSAHLNLITCAGTWLPRAGTYSERLVVYATLAA